MKKSEQIAMNEEVLEAFAHYVTEANKTGLHRVGRLRSCSAQVWETEGYYVLESYNTIIACIDKESMICYDVLRYVYGYTAKSAQHISKFHHDYRATERKTYRQV